MPITLHLHVLYGSQNKNKDFCLTQHSQIGFYDRDGPSLLLAD